MIAVAFVAFVFFLTLLPYELYSLGETHYFLYAFHRIQPQFLARDWLVTQTSNPHPFFAVFLAGLKPLGDLPLALFVIHGFQFFFVVLGILNLTRVFTKDPRTGILVLCLLLFYFSDGLGQESLYSAIVQPSELGRLFYLFSLTALLREKILQSWFFLGLTALFDFLSGFEGLLLFLISWAAQRKWDRRRMVGGLGLFLLLASPNLIPIFKNFSLKDAVESPELLKLLFNFRGPHHYRIITFELAHTFRVLFPLTFILAKGRHPEARPDRLARVYVASLLGLGLLAVASIEWFYFPTITQLRFLRLSPFLLMLGLIFLARSLIEKMDAANPWEKILAGVTLAILFLEKDSRLFVPLSLFLVFAWNLRSLPAMLLVLPVSLYLWKGRGGEWVFDASLGFILFFLLNQKTQTKIHPALIAFLVFGIPAVLFQGFFPERVSFHPIQIAPRPPAFQQDPSLEQALAWIRTQTPQDSLLLTPPQQDGMRFFAERAIVVDFHANPYRLSEVKEWKRRLETVSQTLDLEKWVPRGSDTSLQRKMLREGYLRLNTKKVEAIAHEFGVNYFLTESGFREKKRLTQLGRKLVFENSRYLIFDLN